MGKMKSFSEELEQDDPNIEYEMRLVTFFSDGGNKLGYNWDNHPEIGDIEDVLVNEMPARTYWKLKRHTPGTL